MILNPHLGLFQVMGKTLRDDPTTVTAEMSTWLSNPDSPALWAPFAFSIRGFAYEVMDECELARMDYVQGLNLYDTLMEELGEDVLRRMTNNMTFMRVRLGALPPAAISPVESYFEKYASEIRGDNHMPPHGLIQNGEAENQNEEYLAEEGEQQEELQQPEPDEENTLPDNQVPENWEDDVGIDNIEMNVAVGVENAEYDDENQDDNYPDHDEELENVPVHDETVAQTMELQGTDASSGNILQTDVLDAGLETNTLIDVQATDDQITKELELDLGGAEGGLETEIQLLLE